MHFYVCSPYHHQKNAQGGLWSIHDPAAGDYFDGDSGGWFANGVCATSSSGTHNQSTPRGCRDFARGAQGPAGHLGAYGSRYLDFPSASAGWIENRQPGGAVDDGHYRPGGDVVPDDDGLAARETELFMAWLGPDHQWGRPVCRHFSHHVPVLPLCRLSNRA